MHNQFQLDRSRLMSLLADQIGVSGTCPIGALNGNWDGTPRTLFTFEITRIADSFTGPYVAFGMCDDGVEIACSAALLLRSDVRVDWRPASDSFLSNAEHSSLVRSNAFVRARDIGTRLISALSEEEDLLVTKTAKTRKTRKTRKTPKAAKAAKAVKATKAAKAAKAAKAEDVTGSPLTAAHALERKRGLDEVCVTGDEVVIYTLDGRGSNRRAFLSVFEEAGRPPPRIVTFECNPEPALCQRILYGRDVVYTPGNPLLRARRVNKTKQKPLLEDVLLQEDIAESWMDSNPDGVRLLYLDYCGGPPSGVDMTKMLSRFPNLLVYAGTVSTRAHPGLDDTFEDYVPLLYGFDVAAKFATNKRVRCHVYVRTPAPRAVAVPGWFWNDCPKHLKWKRFKGLMVDEHKACVLTERGREIITLGVTDQKKFATGF